MKDEADHVTVDAIEAILGHPGGTAPDTVVLVCDDEATRDRVAESIGHLADNARARIIIAVGLASIPINGLTTLIHVEPNRRVLALTQLGEALSEMDLKILPEKKRGAADAAIQAQSGNKGAPPTRTHRQAPRPTASGRDIRRFMPRRSA